MAKVYITVTMEDVREGDLGDMLNCPVALALRRRFGAVQAEVGYERASMWIKGDEIEPIHLLTSASLDAAIHEATEDDLPFETGRYALELED